MKVTASTHLHTTRTDVSQIWRKEKIYVKKCESHSIRLSSTDTVLSKYGISTVLKGKSKKVNFDTCSVTHPNNICVVVLFGF